jgi:hypothetical protein
MNDADIKKMLIDAIAEIRAIEDRCEAAIKGKTVRITSNFNGQPHGSSRKPLTGKTFIVDGVWMNGWRACIRLDGERLSVTPDEVVFEP